jgi:hypothetical protein
LLLNEDQDLILPDANQVQDEQLKLGLQQLGNNYLEISSESDIEVVVDDMMRWASKQRPLILDTPL